MSPLGVNTRDALLNASATRREQQRQAVIDRLADLALGRDPLGQHTLTELRALHTQARQLRTGGIRL